MNEQAFCPALELDLSQSTNLTVGGRAERARLWGLTCLAVTETSYRTWGVAQLGKCLPRIHEALCGVVHSCYSSTWEVEAIGS